MASKDRLILFLAMDGVSLAAMIDLDKFNAQSSRREAVGLPLLVMCLPQQTDTAYRMPEDHLFSRKDIEFRLRQ